VKKKWDQGYGRPPDRGSVSGKSATVDPSAPSASEQEKEDAAYSIPESYLYERAIDALVAFLARYVRTALLLARRPSKAVEQLLTDLDSKRPRLMRPLGFMAISYLLLVITMWKALQIEIASESIQQLEHFLGGFGDVDTLQSLLVAPLPGVVLVVLISNTLARRVREAGPRDQGRIAAMLQYAVGLGLFSLCVVLVAVRGMTRSFDWLVAMEEGGWARNSAPKEDIFQAVLMGYAVLIPVMLVFPLFISVMPVARAIGRIEVLSTLSWFRKLRFCVTGPLVLLLTISALGGLAWVGGQMMPPPLVLDVQDSELRDEKVTAQLMVSVAGDRPVVVEGWSGVWLDAADTTFACDHLDREGTLLREGAPRHDPPALPSSATVEVIVGSARLEGTKLLMLPETSAFARLTSDDPGEETRREGLLTWCYRIHGDAIPWRPVQAPRFEANLVPELEIPDIDLTGVIPEDLPVPSLP